MLGRSASSPLVCRPADLSSYVGDRKPGQVLCQNVEEFGGRWLVMRASGTLLR
jgi:hypothetical protein